MAEKIFHLPQDIFPDRNLVPGQLILNEYVATAATARGKSILTMNAVSLVVSGNKVMHFAEKKVDITDDSFHLLSAGNCIAATHFDKHSEFRSVLLYFDQDAVTKFQLLHKKRIEEKRKTLNVSPAPYISIKKDNYIRNFIDSLRMAPTSLRSEEFLWIKFEEFMLYLLETHALEILSFWEVKTVDNHELNLRSIVEANITNKLSLNDLAFLCGMSLSTFKRRFVATYGISPSKYFLQRRMDIAANLLKLSTEKPSDVFHKVGYENHSSFSQSFKQLYGVSPSEYQEKKLSL